MIDNVKKRWTQCKKIEVMLSVSKHNYVLIGVTVFSPLELA